MTEMGPWKTVYLKIGHVMVRETGKVRVSHYQPFAINLKVPVYEFALCVWVRVYLVGLRSNRLNVLVGQVLLLAVSLGLGISISRVP